VIPVNGDGIMYGLYDFVYSDAACTIPLVDNYYLSGFCPPGDKWFRIENGIIVEFGDCEENFKYIVKNCLIKQTLVVLSPFPLTINMGTVELTDPAYAGCRFFPADVAERLAIPVDIVSNYYPMEECANICGYYKVYNYDSKPAIVDYKDCDGIEQVTTIPVHSFIYLCAQINNISSKQRTMLFSQPIHPALPWQEQT